MRLFDVRPRADGWEDLAGGGDRDFNDLVVRLDFASTAGLGLLVA